MAEQGAKGATLEQLRRASCSAIFRQHQDERKLTNLPVAARWFHMRPSRATKAAIPRHLMHALTVLGACDDPQSLEIDPPPSSC